MQLSIQNKINDKSVNSHSVYFRNTSRFAFLCNPIFKKFIYTILILCCLQVVFLSLNLIAELFPKQTIEENINKSLDDPLIKNGRERSISLFGSRVAYDNNHYIIWIAEQKQHDNILETSLLASITNTLRHPAQSYDYFRYWHGWQFFTNFSLLLGPIQVLSFLVFVFEIISTLFLYFQLKKYLGMLPSICFIGISLFCTGIFGNFMGDILLSISVFSIVLFSAIILKYGHKGTNHLSVLSYIVVISGAVFCYLDFLTIPAFAISMIVFVSVLSQGFSFNTIFEGILVLVKYFLLFLLGFLFTWAFKWVLVAFLEGPNYVINNVTSEMSQWLGTHEASPSGLMEYIYNFSPRIYAIVQGILVTFVPDPDNLDLLDNVIKYPAGPICLLVSLICIIFYFSRLIIGHIKRIKLSDTFLNTYKKENILLLVCLIIPIYCFIMAAHTIWHMRIFGYKSWSIVLAIISTVFLLKAIQLYKYQKDHAKKISSNS